MAIDRASSDEVAVAHYEWIKRGLIDAGIDANTYNIAMAWNCGLGAVVGGHVPSVSYQYADRVRNLVNTIKQQERDTVASAPKVVPAPAHPKSNFDLEFDTDHSKPHFVLEDDSQAPLLVVSTESPRFGLSLPGVFALASTN
ncbi:MAG TPA: hypothetical protein VHD32_14915 [Candidatus Didemnitutus sp.]|nr:hypothetical protein [Candidatus Didemnitutus sp.]